MSWLALVRHGDLNGRALSPGGWRQAEAAGRRLAGLSPALAEVRASTAPRTRETASAICSFLGLPEPRLDERLWSGPDGLPGGWEHDSRGLADRLRGDLAELERQAAEAGGRALLVVVTHFEICAALPAAIASDWGLPGTPPQGLARGQGWLVDGLAHRGRMLRT